MSGSYSNADGHPQVKNMVNAESASTISGADIKMSGVAEESNASSSDPVEGPARNEAVPPSENIHCCVSSPSCEDDHSCDLDDILPAKTAGKFPPSEQPEAQTEAKIKEAEALTISNVEEAPEISGMQQGGLAALQEERNPRRESEGVKEPEKEEPGQKQEVPQDLPEQAQPRNALPNAIRMPVFAGQTSPYMSLTAAALLHSGLQWQAKNGGTQQSPYSPPSIANHMGGLQPCMINHGSGLRTQGVNIVNKGPNLPEGVGSNSGVEHNIPTTNWHNAFGVYDEDDEDDFEDYYDDHGEADDNDHDDGDDSWDLRDRTLEDSRDWFRQRPENLNMYIGWVRRTELIRSQTVQIGKVKRLQSLASTDPNHPELRRRFKSSATEGLGAALERWLAKAEGQLRRTQSEHRLAQEQADGQMLALYRRQYAARHGRDFERAFGQVLDPKTDEERSERRRAERLYKRRWSADPAAEYPLEMLDE